MIARTTWLLMWAGFLAMGCSSHSQPATAPATLPVGVTGMHAQELHAICCPPASWQPSAVDPSEKAQQLVWSSPSGDTAYGVIFIALPLPVGTELTLRGFLAEMRQREGKAELVSKQKDEAADALRFVARMPEYEMRGKLMVRGTWGWVSFASTATTRPIRTDELAVAEKAREQTRPDK